MTTHLSNLCHLWAKLSLGAAGLALIACGGGGAGKDNKLTIAMIAKSSTNPVFLASRTGAEAAAKELSAQYKIDVQVVWLTPPQ